MYRVTKTADFEASHFIEGHKGLCKSQHGHSYLVEVTVKGGELDKLGMLIDFSDLKRILKDVVEPFDHAFVYNEFSELDATKLKVALAKQLNEKICAFPGNTTAENMAKYFFTRIEQELAARYEGVIGDVIAVEKVTVHEKSGNPATYSEE